MANSEVAVANRALTLLKQNGITALDESSAEARVVNAVFADSRDALLRAYPWNFAMRRASLGALDGAPAWGFAKRYQLPEGPSPEYCLRVVAIDGADDWAAPWKVEGRLIVTDIAAPLLISYVARIEDVAQWDALFVDALAARLAAEIAFTLTGSAALAGEMREHAARALAEARAMDAQEGSAERFDADDFLDARL